MVRYGIVVWVIPSSSLLLNYLELLLSLAVSVCFKLIVIYETHRCATCQWCHHCWYLIIVCIWVVGESQRWLWASCMSLQLPIVNPTHPCCCRFNHHHRAPWWPIVGIGWHDVEGTPTPGLAMQGGQFRWHNDVITMTMMLSCRKSWRLWYLV